ncbi:ABC transporter ATP-binding protein [Bifidobacterium myosotis]|uniref:ABC transporter ATP-binding protein n=1 Tax=Bifidobacterium myosotis TaxID=1630166 RepID=A0A261FMG3_9BIFI|nr:ABC transporter ATP-binding protein [Bifidobacterium myosotis]
MNRTNVFTAERVGCAVPSADGDRVIFEGLSFAIAAGEIVDLVGPSGSGKSSLLTAFARLNPHATGTLALQGRDANDFTPQQWRREVAYLPQKPILPGRTVAEAIRLPFSLAIRADAEGAADGGETGTAAADANKSADGMQARGDGGDGANSHAGGTGGAGGDGNADAGTTVNTGRRIGHIGIGRKFLALFRNNEEQARRLLPDQRIRITLDAIGCDDIDLDRPPHDLSGGQAARVSLARTLLTGPKVLLADEVDAGLDDENAEKVADIMATAAARGMAIVRIRHRPPDGRASRIVTLADGVLAAGAAGTAAFAVTGTAVDTAAGAVTSTAPVPGTVTGMPSDTNLSTTARRVRA